MLEFVRMTEIRSKKNRWLFQFPLKLVLALKRALPSLRMKEEKASHVFGGNLPPPSASAFGHASDRPGPLRIGIEGVLAAGSDSAGKNETGADGRSDERKTRSLRGNLTF